MISFKQSTTPIYDSNELTNIENLWNKKTEIIKYQKDRSYTSCYIIKELTYTNKLLDWAELQLGFKINRESYNLILHKFRTGDYFFKHCDNVYRNNNYKTYVIGCNLNNDYSGGEYVVYLKNEIVINTKPGVPYIMKSDVMHEIKPVKNGTRKSALVFLYDYNTNIQTFI